MKVLLLFLCAGCATPGSGRVLGPATVYEDVSAPLAYRADAYRGAREVRGEACQTGIFLPVIRASIAWGDGGSTPHIRPKRASSAPSSVNAASTAPVIGTRRVLAGHRSLSTSASARRSARRASRATAAVTPTSVANHAQEPVPASCTACCASGMSEPSQA